MDGNGARDHDHPFGGGEFRVPDDASALDADRLAWLAEDRARRHRDRLRRMVLTRHYDRFGISGPLVVMCLAITALVGALLVVVVPSGAHPPPRPRALADVPPIAVPTPGAEASVPAAPSVEISTGSMVGRRLPDAPLQSDVGPLSTPELRPAVILLALPSCGCAAAVKALYRQAQRFRLPLWIVSAGTSASGRAQLARLDDQGTAGGARWAQDGGAVLHRALRAGGLTIVLVTSDGVVTSVLRDIPADGRGVPALELVLVLLTSPSE
jgi:hypothetical protein